MLATLQAIDQTVLANVVRQDQRSDSFEIGDWSVRRLSNQGFANPEGLWVYSGYGRDGQAERPWSVVLKVLKKNDVEVPIDNFFHWQRELFVAQSGLTRRMPGPVQAPRFYSAEEAPGGAWLWMEHVHDAHPGRWSLDNYIFAARELGRWNGACFQAAPTLDNPWLSRKIYRDFIGWVNPEDDWQFPLLQKHIPAEQRARYDRLWAEREDYYQALERLPQTFMHCDAQRRNLAIRSNGGGQNELVAIDWALCGWGPLGAEMGALIGMSPAFLEWPPSRVRELDAAAFPSYVQALREAGWSGEVDALRLACTAWLVMYVGLALPAAMARYCAPEHRDIALAILGMAGEELFWEYTIGLDHALHCADEARTLMHRLGV